MIISSNRYTESLLLTTYEDGSGASSIFERWAVQNLTRQAFFLSFDHKPNVKTGDCGTGNFPQKLKVMTKKAPTPLPRSRLGSQRTVGIPQPKASLVALTNFEHWAIAQCPPGIDCITE